MDVWFCTQTKLTALYSPDYLWFNRVIRISEGAGLIPVALLRGKIYSAIRHGINNQFFYVILFRDM